MIEILTFLLMGSVILSIRTEYGEIHFIIRIPNVLTWHLLQELQSGWVYP
jgi:hypothetical protein